MTTAAWVRVTEVRSSVLAVQDAIHFCTHRCY